jgi:hypothetical protein
MGDILKHAFLGAIFAVALAVSWGVIGQVTYAVIAML